MKIDSTKNFLQKAYGIIEFDGSGSADGATTRDGKLFPLKGAGLSTESDKGNYIVVVKTAIGDMRIPLNKVTNQETWLNTAEGRDKAWSDIVTWIKECEEVTSGGASEVTGGVKVLNTIADDAPFSVSIREQSEYPIPVYTTGDNKVAAYDPNLYPLPWDKYSTGLVGDNEAVGTIAFYKSDIPVFVWTYEYDNGYDKAPSLFTVSLA
jgi:hypothetical protein